MIEDEPETAILRPVRGHILTPIPEVSTDLRLDLDSMLKPELKELARSRGLTVSGTKAELRERVELSLDEDLSRLQIMRDQLGETNLWIDVNQGWSLDQALGILPYLESLNISNSAAIVFHHINQQKKTS